MYDTFASGWFAFPPAASVSLHPPPWWIINIHHRHVGHANQDDLPPKWMMMVITLAFDMIHSLRNDGKEYLN